MQKENQDAAEISMLQKRLESFKHAIKAAEERLSVLKQSKSVKDDYAFACKELIKVDQQLAAISRYIGCLTQYPDSYTDVQISRIAHGLFLVCVTDFVGCKHTKQIMQSNQELNRDSISDMRQPLLAKLNEEVVSGLKKQREKLERIRHAAQEQIKCLTGIMEKKNEYRNESEVKPLVSVSLPDYYFRYRFTPRHKAWKD